MDDNLGIRGQSRSEIFGNVGEPTFPCPTQATLDGFNGTIFAYGQTGTGKTFYIHIAV